MRSQIILLSLLGSLNPALARFSFYPRQDSTCTSGGTFYCCAYDPTVYGGSACFTQSDPCDQDSIYPDAYCCDEVNGSTDFSTCYNPNPPPPQPSGNACAPGQNLECCNGDPATDDPNDPDSGAGCDLTEHECDPNSIYFPQAYCCDQADGETEFYTCQPVGNNGAAPQN